MIRSHFHRAQLLATIGFCLKAGLALGSASFLWIMDWFFDYDTKLPSAAHAVSGYRVTASIVVGLMFATCTVLLTIYRLNKRATIEMSNELARRRAEAERASA